VRRFGVDIRWGTDWPEGGQALPLGDQKGVGGQASLDSQDPNRRR